MTKNGCWLCQCLACNTLTTEHSTSVRSVLCLVLPPAGAFIPPQLKRPGHPERQNGETLRFLTRIIVYSSPSRAAPDRRWSGELTA
jgi:hypothetical protein